MMRLIFATLLLLYFNVVTAESANEAIPLEVTINAWRQMHALQKMKQLKEIESKHTADFTPSPLYAVASFSTPKKHKTLRYIPKIRSSIYEESETYVTVDIKAPVSDELLHTIEAEGGTIITSFIDYQAIRARIPRNKIAYLAKRSDILLISMAEQGFTAKQNTTEGDVAHNAQLGRQTSSIDGTGIKVGVISDSVDYLAQAVQQGDLPTNVTVVQDAAAVDAKGVGEGTAMLEIIHDIAPGAQLFFATGFGGEANYANNILELYQLGCRVIVDDFVYSSEFPFQDGIITKAINKITAAGTLYFSAAGNSGNFKYGTSGVWEGDFKPGKYVSEIGYPHDFGDGEILNRITQTISKPISLHWADPLEYATNDYDLCLFDQQGKIDTCSMEVQKGYYSQPFEVITPGKRGTIPKGYYIAIFKKKASKNRFLHLNTDGGNLLYSTKGAIKHHAIAVNAFAVAQTNAKNKISPFNGQEIVLKESSDGPRRIFFDAEGMAITPDNFSATGGKLRAKPDLTAASCVMTTVPDFSPFCGTSAAAPHAAAIAALLLAKNNTLTVAEIRDIFQQAAIDIEAVGRDDNSGVGIIMAERALALVHAQECCEP